jgi:hypothetical protein
MASKVDNSVILYGFAIDLEKRGYDIAVLDEWIAHYPSAGDELMDFFIDELRIEEMHSEDERAIPTPALDGIKATGRSQLQLRLIRRRDGAAKRA